MTSSFISLPTAPEAGISDLGLIEAMPLTFGCWWITFPPGAIGRSNPVRR